METTYKIKMQSVLEKLEIKGKRTNSSIRKTPTGTYLIITTMTEDQ